MDLKDIDPSVADLVLFLRDGLKTDLEILAGIPGFKYDTLGTACGLGLIEHCYPTVWLTGSGERLATTLNQLKKVL